MHRFAAVFGRTRRAVVFWVALLLFRELMSGATPTGLAPNYLVHIWQTDNGLPQNWVSSIAQTPDGYLWVGTRYGGLARFDGVRFVPFNPQNTPELKDVQVEFLSVDGAGRLWVVMGNESINAMADGEFTLFRQPRTEPRLRAMQALITRPDSILFTGEYAYLATLDLAAGTNGWTVHDPRPRFEANPRTFVVDRNETVWFTTLNQRLSRFREGRLELANTLPGLIEPRTVGLAVDREGQLWTASPRRLLSWDGEAFVDRTPAEGPPPRDILRIAFSGDGGLWVLERNRLRKFRDGQWVVTADQNPLADQTGEGGIELHGDAQGGAWVIHYGHGFSHTKSTGALHQFSERDGLPNLFITCWYEDPEGNVWIGTAGGGLIRIRESIFTTFTTADGLPGRVVRSVCVDSADTLWAGTMSGGLARWRDGQLERTPLPVPSVPPVESVTVCPDLTGQLWIGSLNHGLLQMQAGEIGRLAAGFGQNVAVRVLFTDRRNDLWVGGLVNLFRYTAGRFYQFGSKDGFVDSHAIGALAEDEAGNLWIGTGPGDLWRYTPAGEFTRFTPPAEWPSVRFSAVLPDTNGVVWVGTLGGGLLRFKDGQFTRCTLEYGLPDNNVSQLLDSGDGHLWAGTYAGIFRANKVELESVATGHAPRVACRVYGRFDGLPALECSSGFQPSCWRAGDGRLWFATANGVVSVDPTAIAANSQPPIVIIEEMFVDGKKRSLRAHRASGKSRVMEIEPGRHYVQFHFTGLNFAAPDGVRFRAKLEGVDAEWQDLAGQRSIGYGPLRPGDYRLRVIACNNDGVWNEAGDTLRFSVQPFFWETWWFRALLAVALFSGLGLAVALAQRRRYRRKLDDVERQRVTERERTRIAQDLHDDLGTSLTQISMLSALANREQTPPAEARELIDQVRGRAREMVTALDEIVWAVNPKNDSVRGLINYLGHFAEEFFRPTGIRCRLDLPHQLPPQTLSADLRHHLFLAFKEAVNNVARHSGANEVEIRSEIQRNEIMIQVKDRGRGFEPPTDATRRTGNGLINLRKRMEQAGGRAEIASVVGQGTAVSFYLPIQSGNAAS